MEDWKKEHLGNVADIIDPHPSHRAPTIVADGIPFLGIGDIDENGKINNLSARKVAEQNFVEHQKRYKIGANTIGFGRVATIGKVIKFGERKDKIVISPTMAIIEPHQVNGLLLFYLLNSAKSKKEVDKLLTGSTRSSLGIELLRKIVIEFPTEETEQKRIAEILWTADEAIEQTQALIDKYNRIKRGLMQDLLTRGIDENGDIRSKQTHKFTVKNGIEVPDDWDVVRLDTFANLITSGSRGWAKYYSVEGDKFIRIGNLTRENIDLRLNNLAFVNSPQGSEGDRTALQFDDLLISITADLGIIGIVPNDFGKAYINQHIALVRFDKNFIFPRWVAYFLASEKGQYQFQTLNESGAKAGLNLPTVASLMVAFPKIEEQRQIVKNLDALLDIIGKEKTKLVKLQAIKKGLMQDLLSGKVRVKIENENKLIQNA